MHVVLVILTLVLIGIFFLPYYDRPWDLPTDTYSTLLLTMKTEIFRLLIFTVERCIFSIFVASIVGSICFG